MFAVVTDVQASCAMCINTDNQLSREPSREFGPRLNVISECNWYMACTRINFRFLCCLCRCSDEHFLAYLATCFKESNWFLMQCRLRDPTLNVLRLAAQRFHSDVIMGCRWWNPQTLLRNVLTLYAHTVMNLSASWPSQTMFYSFIK